MNSGLELNPNRSINESWQISDFELALSVYRKRVSIELNLKWVEPCEFETDSLV